jgi:hypothetical protein
MEINRRYQMQKFGMILILALMVTSSSNGMAGSFSDYLIMQDIGSYKFMAKGGGGQGSGILAPTGHFNKDHADESYGGVYFCDANEIAVNVEVTKHAGSDSDKWLGHELDEDFRNYYGNPGDSYGPLVIDGQTILEDSVAGANYRWLSGTKVIIITYHDSQLTKLEPIEVVKAYLAKHPSMLPAMTLQELRSIANKTTWIKDEIDRRLWLCDKWFMQLQLKKAEGTQVYQESIKSMNVFLDYREKYYGLKAATEKNLLAGYLNTNNGTAIKVKLTEYKKWWTVNKEKAISL